MIRVSVVDPSNPGKIIGEAEAESLKELAPVLLEEVWSPSIFEGDTRSVANFKSTQLVVLDVDEGCTIEQAQELFKEFSHLIMTTRNHQKDKNGKKADRFRVVLLLDKEVTDALDHQATMDWVLATYPFADRACRDAARMFYPSIDITAQQAFGRPVSAVQYLPRERHSTTGSPGSISPTESSPGEAHGRLWRSTLELLSFGAEPGHRHRALVQAAGNMREQGYTEDEAYALVEHMSHNPQASWTQVGLNEADLKTINRMYARDPKYPFEPNPVDDARVALAGSVDGVELVDEMFAYVRDKERMIGTATGIEGLDDMMGGGFRKGELNVFSASAKTGKSSLFHYLIYNLLKSGNKVGYASRELTPSTEVLPNLLSIDTGKNLYKLEESDLTEAYVRMVKECVARWPITFAQGYGYFPLHDMEHWIADLKERGVDFFFQDHLHHLVATEDHAEISATIKHIKTMTKKYDVCMNLIVQPRTLREGEKPNLNTIRGGAVINQALDNLFIVERLRDQANLSKLTLEIARHKLCTPGEIYLQYDKESMRFEEMKREVVNIQEQVNQQRVYD